MCKVTWVGDDKHFKPYLSSIEGMLYIVGICTSLYSSGSQLLYIITPNNGISNSHYPKLLLAINV